MSGALQDVSTALEIPVVGAVGTGPTVLAAFDDALVAAGVANYNLVRLSSVIPPATVIVASEERRSGVAPNAVDLRVPVARHGVWGDRLYAVWAFEGAQVLGQEAWAGVGWVQHPDDGRGLFVEHEGGSEAQVRAELQATLGAICASRGLAGLDHQTVVIGTRCEGEPVGALVIAPFLAESWS